MMRRNMLDLTHAAELLGTTAAEVRHLVADGSIPHLMVGPFVRFDATILTRWRDDSEMADRSGDENPSPRIDLTVDWLTTSTTHS